VILDVCLGAGRFLGQKPAKIFRERMVARLNLIVLAEEQVTRRERSTHLAIEHRVGQLLSENGHRLGSVGSPVIATASGVGVMIESI